MHHTVTVRKPNREEDSGQVALHDHPWVRAFHARQHIGVHISDAEPGIDARSASGVKVVILQYLNEVKIRADALGRGPGPSFQQPRAAYRHIASLLSATSVCDNSCRVYEEKPGVIGAGSNSGRLQTRGLRPRLVAAATRASGL